MPLIYHHEGKQDHKRGKKVVEMQIAVSFDEELGVLQSRITTIQCRFLQVVAIPVVLNFVLEDFHAKNGIDIIKYLKYIASLIERLGCKYNSVFTLAETETETDSKKIGLHSNVSNSIDLCLHLSRFGQCKHTISRVKQDIFRRTSVELTTTTIL